MYTITFFLIIQTYLIYEQYKSIINIYSYQPNLPPAVFLDAWQQKRGMIKSHLISYTNIQLKYLNQIILYSKHGGLCSISHIKLFEDA